MDFAPRQPDAPAAFTLGCMNFGKRTPAPEARRIIDRAIDAGITLLDTANAYTNGASERIVGPAARGRAMIATKVGLAKGDDLSESGVIAACEASLGRLGVDAIDLYYLHAPDPRHPVQGTLAALKTLLEAGKIRRWGVSNFASWQTLELRGLAASADMPLPAVAQQLYNPLIRQLDIEYFAFARRYALHTTVYNPLAGGLLAQAATAGAPVPNARFANPMYQRRYWHERQHAAVDALRQIAQSEGVSLLALAYGFSANTPGVDSVLLGPATVAHLDAALACRDYCPSDAAFRQMLAVYHALVGTDARYAR